MCGLLNQCQRCTSIVTEKWLDLHLRVSTEEENGLSSTVQGWTCVVCRACVRCLSTLCTEYDSVISDLSVTQVCKVFLPTM